MLTNDRLLRAARRQPVDRVPVWFMRQAGRYQPEYRKVREKYTLMEICEHPEVCAEVTILPVKQLDVDAAILFSDIMTPLRGMGLGVDIVENVGPVFDKPIRTMQDVAAIPQLNAEEMVPYVLDTIKILVRELNVPLLGFAGAPFTLASYAVEGKPTKDYKTVKNLMYSEPKVWAALMEKLSDMVSTYLVDQIHAGCHAVQLFDSWVGNLNRADYDKYVKPHMYGIINAVKKTGAPLILFGVHTGHLLKSFSDLGADVIGIDWKEEMDKAWNVVGPQHAVQGNLDPIAVFAPEDVMREKVHDVLRRTEGRPGHIFNLGHGCMPSMQISALQKVVEMVHSYDHKEAR
ncbi:MAG TPA: uroporphyrinogen decarboxylase [Symbiobacteriaceae bacterium]|nr:uroporphyrinogen decarboxylase [Symbiobacteriaceae bacterium]